MATTAETKLLLETIDKNPLLKQSVRSGSLFQQLMGEGLIVYGGCGCSFPTVHVSKKGRDFLKSLSPTTPAE